jgi:hypothetical protein
MRSPNNREDLAPKRRDVAARGKPRLRQKLAPGEHPGKDPADLPSKTEALSAEAIEVKPESTRLPALVATGHGIFGRKKIREDAKCHYSVESDV